MDLPNHFIVSCGYDVIDCMVGLCREMVEACVSLLYGHSWQRGWKDCNMCTC